MIRDINNNDYEILIKLYKENFNVDVNFNELFKIQKVYVINNKIIGFIDYSIIYERAELNYIFVVNSMRLQNIASQLIENMLIDLTNSKVSNITLEVNVNNISAINLYKKYGFIIESTRENYYYGEDAYLMMKVM